MKEFDFEELKVYQRALDFVDEVFALTDSFSSRIQYSLGDQLRRAALSIANNIAEGSNKQSSKERMRYYCIARDSARECIPMFTISLRRKLLSEEIHNHLRGECLTICKMLFKLIDSVK